MPVATSHALDDFVASLTNSPAETKAWGSLQRSLTSVSEHVAGLPGAGFGCREVTDLATDLNRLALCAYLQGFNDLATELSTRQIELLGRSPCACARVSQVQPWINLARLARARADRPALARAALELTAALDAATAAEPGELPPAVAAEVVDGELARIMQHVATIEEAKLEWGLGDRAACERTAAPVASESGTAMELTIRCVLEREAWDEAVALAATYVSRFAWLRVYAAVALLRGGAEDAAFEVIGSLDRESTLPLLRLALVLSATGWHDEAHALGERMLLGGLEEGSEVTAMLAATFLLRIGESPDEHARAAVDRVAAASWHHACAELYRAASGAERAGAVSAEARAATTAVAEATLEALRLAAASEH